MVLTRFPVTLRYNDVFFSGPLLISGSRQSINQPGTKVNFYIRISGFICSDLSLIAETRIRIKYWTISK